MKILGVVIEYNAFLRPNGIINIGTFFVTKSKTYFCYLTANTNNPHYYRVSARQLLAAVSKNRHFQATSKTKQRPKLRRVSIEKKPLRNSAGLFCIFTCFDFVFYLFNFNYLFFCL